MLSSIKNKKVVGTASIDRYKGDKTGKKYIVLTVFVKIKIIDKEQEKN